MRCVAVDKKVAFKSLRDGISAYHFELFHGRLVNKTVDDNNLGDVLKIPLQLEKDVYDCRRITQPQRNLVVPQTAKQKLAGVPNIAFFQVVFTKLFLVPFRKGDLSLGPEDYIDLEKWLKSFPHQEELRNGIEAHYELILPLHKRLLKEFTETQIVEFNLVDWCKASLQLSEAMLQKYPAIWTVEGIVFREDVFRLIEEFFVWDYFDRCQFEVA